MLRTGRILLVEPSDRLRDEFRDRLTAAGHDVAAVPDEARAEVLLDEGLDPDVILVRVGHGRMLRDLAPRAVQLASNPPAPERRTGDRRRGPRELSHSLPGPADVVHRVEEALLGHAGPGPGSDETLLAMDLARRLANSLPCTRTVEERIDLLGDSFHASFGVVGSLVIRREAEEWIEIGQGLEDDVVAAISSEVARRRAYRDIRPFLASVRVREDRHDIACVAVHRGEVETDLALHLARAPQDPMLREALMNLVGSSLRAAASVAALERAEATVERELPVFETLLSLSRDFSGVAHRGLLCQRILDAVRAHLGMSRSAIFLPPPGGEGLLALEAVAGFSSVMLGRIGLSGRHGVGQEILSRDVPSRIAGVAGAGRRESGMLTETGLQWGVPLGEGEHRRGILVFGSPDGESRLDPGGTRALEALLGAAAVALRNLDKLEELQGLSLASLRGLAHAVELAEPGTEGHAERVARHAARIGRAIALGADEIRQLSYCGFLHDVGKIGAPHEEDEGADAAHKHPARATRILGGAKLPHSIIQGVEQHSERWDGRGHPYGLCGGAIHLFARIVAVADGFDRVAGEGGDAEREQGLRHLELGAGILYDPGLASVFVGEMRQESARRDPPSREMSLEEIVGA